MKERVQELLNKVETRGETASGDAIIISYAQLGDFAELIVKECIAQCNDGDSRYFIATHFGIPEPRVWLCPKCGIDRTKEVCPNGHHAALTGHCPMVGVAQ
jgi:hypothetical protein